jgi:hypothetical protein
MPQVRRTQRAVAQEAGELAVPPLRHGVGPARPRETARTTEGMMKAQLTIEVRVNQVGSYANSFTLGDAYNVELASLGAFASVLVKIHEAIVEIVKQHGAKV